MGFLGGGGTGCLGPLPGGGGGGGGAGAFLSPGGGGACGGAFTVFCSFTVEAPSSSGGTAGAGTYAAQQRCI